MRQRGGLTISVLAGVTLGLAGCATPDAKVAQLTAENQGLKTQLDNAKRENAQLDSDLRFQKTETEYFTRRSKVLLAEKEQRLGEIQALRKGVRQFQDDVVISLKQSYQRTVPADLLGSEVCKRALTPTDEAAAEIMLVDTSHALATGGTVTSGRAYTTGPCKVQFFVLRPEPEKGYKIAWISNELSAEGDGLQTWEFAVPFVVRAGDLFGVYGPAGLPIPYDDTDTGAVAAVPGRAKLNGSVTLPLPAARHNRAYSFGLAGYMESQ